MKPSLHAIRQVKSAGILFLIGTLVAGAGTARAISPAEEPVVQAVDKTLPAVVNINTETLVQGLGRDPYDVFFNRYYVVEKSVPSLGSGVLISPDGYIVTNSHVVARSEKGKIQVTMQNGAIYQAKLLSEDPDKDLALIKIDDNKPFPFIDLKNLSPNLLGQTVIAMGNPVGYQNSVSVGILSAKNRTVKNQDGTAMDGLLQTDAAINPGNSGGALVDINGKFVGLNSAKQFGQAIEGLGFAVPGETVSPWVTDAIAVAKGEKKAPEPVSLVSIIKDRFGLSLQELTPELAETFGYRSRLGLLISDVQEGSPAAKAGIKRGMLVVRVGSSTVLTEASLPRQLNRVKKGEKVTFTIAFIEARGNFAVQRSQGVNLEAR